MKWSEKRCIVLDMDGTVYLGNTPIAGAVSFIVRHWSECDFYFLTNNTSRSLNGYIQKLRGMGIYTDRSRMLSPILPLVEYLRKSQLRTLYLVANRDFTCELTTAMPELVLAESGAEAVVLAYDTELTYEKLARSALLLQKGLPFFATHPDLVCPSPEGPLPDVGSMLSLYETATGRRPDRIFGKPDPLILSPLFSRYTRESMIMVGDRLSTDMQLARNAGIDFALVLSGEAKREDLQGLSYTPTFVLADLGCAEAYWV
ncbi:MAG: HAD-IIA family hydrolase [Desulfovibrionaceae bacterium]|nr:HAD-IIA family hydrolase [Desulfovibrionaceae bacterium]